MKKNILIIHPEGNVHNNPNLYAIVRGFCEHGYHVDLFSVRNPGIYQGAVSDESDHYLFENPRKLDKNLGFVSFLDLPEINENSIVAFVRESLKKYDLIIGVDRGIIEASIIGKIQQTPIALISYEIFYADEAGSEFKLPEITACKNVSFSICQDRLRSRNLSEQNDIPYDRIIQIPVIGSKFHENPRSKFLHDKLGIPRSKKIALYAGSLSKWSGTDYFLECVRTWPEDWALVIHARYRNDAYLNNLNLAELDKKVYISYDTYNNVDEMAEMLGSADIGMSYYHASYESIYTGKNLEYIGLSSGKTFTYLQNGLPVCVNNTGELCDLVVNSGWGISYDKTKPFSMELSDAQLERFRENILSGVPEKLNFDRLFEPVLQAADKLTGNNRSADGKSIESNAIHAGHSSDNQAEKAAAACKEERNENPHHSIANIVTGSGYAGYKVTAIVSTYNSESFIEGCLNDLVGQTLFKKGGLEILVIDSASPQNEKVIVESFQRRYEHIKYLRTDKRETLYAAWNRGCKMAMGEYITNANTDDRHKSDCMEVLAAALDSHPEAGMVYGDALITEKPNETFENNSAVSCYVFPECSVRQALARQFFGPQPMWRKNIHEKIGYFDDSHIVAGDYDFFIRTVSAFGGYHVKEFLGLYCKRADSVERANKDSNAVEEQSLIRKHRIHTAMEIIYPNLAASSANSETAYSAYNDFSLICAQSIPTPDIALDLLWKAVTLDQENPVAYNNIAVLLMNLGRAEEAKRIFEKLRGVNDRIIQQNCALLSQSPANYDQLLLMEMRGDYLNNQPPVFMGSLEHTIEDGKNLQQRLRRLESYRCLAKAQECVASGDYSTAIRLTDHYRNGVDYSLIPFIDNRLKNQQPAVSIIIVAYKTSRELVKCVNSVFAQSASDYEVILVDNGGNDDVLNEILSFELLYINPGWNLRPSEGRNVGANYARGNILYFVDDDAVVHKESVTAVIEAFGSYPDMKALRGNVAPKNSVSNHPLAGHYDMGAKPLIISYADTEGNSAIDKTTFNSLKGMNPALFGGEGFELSRRIHGLYGFGAIMYIPQVVIYHDYADTETKLVSKQKRHRSVTGFLNFLHPDIESFRHLSKAEVYITNVQPDQKKNNNPGKRIIELVSPETGHDGKIVAENNDYKLKLSRKATPGGIHIFAAKTQPGGDTFEVEEYSRILEEYCSSGDSALKEIELNENIQIAMGSKENGKEKPITDPQAFLEPGQEYYRIVGKLIHFIQNENYKEASLVLETIFSAENEGKLQIPLEQKEHFKKLAKKFEQILK